jgi:hypothetical protein
MEPAVVDFNPAIRRRTDHIGVSMTMPDIRVIVGFSGMDGLRCNHVIPRDRAFVSRQRQFLDRLMPNPVERCKDRVEDHKTSAAPAMNAGHDAVMQRWLMSAQKLR